MTTIGVVDDQGSMVKKLVEVLKRSPDKHSYHLHIYGDPYLTYDTGDELVNLRGLLEDAHIRSAVFSLDKENFVIQSQIAIISKGSPKNLSYFFSYVSALIEGKDGRVFFEADGSARLVAALHDMCVLTCQDDLLGALMMNGQVVLSDSANDEDLAAFIGLRLS